MRFSFWPKPAQAWDDLLAVCRHAEATGWDGIYFADHFMGQDDKDDALLECWSVLAALGAAVPRVRLGALVSGNTYRHPALLANIATTIDHISGGRLVVGIGGGWQENEHTAYGIDFFDVPGRLRRLDEACQILRGLFDEHRVDFHGRHYELVDAPLEPKPVQAHLPLLVGGGGEKVTMRIAAQHADEWNTWGLPPHLARKAAVLDAHCERLGRDPAAIHRSAQCLVFLSTDPDWVAAHQHLAGPGRPTLVGTPDTVIATMKAYEEAGIGEFILPQFNLGGRDETIAALDLFHREVAAALA
jgi:F420-dependent oxidoreductase-like protein